MIAEQFQEQIQIIPELTDYVLERAEYKTVWSGKRMRSGDRVLYAYVYQKGTDNLKYINFLERELHELDSTFNFIRLEDEIMPVLAFKDDPKNR
jgi:hypothetical protein